MLEVATISADIVRSTSLAAGELIELRKRLQDLFVEIEGKSPGFWARIVRGDSIECYVPEYKDVLRIAILMKLLVKMSVSEYDCSAMLKRYGIRFSIGIASMQIASKEDDILNGQAITLSGRNLDELSRKNGSVTDDIISIQPKNMYGRNLDEITSKNSSMTVFEMEPAPQTFSNLLNSYVAMLSGMVDSYSAKQAEVIYYKLLGYKEVDISERLGIYQSSVNTRATSAQWGLLNGAIKDFEDFDFVRVCG